MAVNTERLFPVVVAPDLLDSFEPSVRIIVDLGQIRPLKGNASHQETEPMAVLETLLMNWGNLGGFAAMPNEDILRGTSLPRRNVFSSCGFRLSEVRQKTDNRIEWLVLYDGISEAWLDVLLNCLEAYHVGIASIARVELTSDLEDNPA